MEDFKSTSDEIGRCRNLGQDSASRPFDTIYGRPSAFGRKSKTQVSAEEVIRGRYSPRDQMPDEDLGKSITPGFRNIAVEVRLSSFLFLMKFLILFCFYYYFLLPSCLIL